MELRAIDELPVDERPVARSAVGDDDAPLGNGERRVTSGHGRVVQHDVVRPRIAADAVRARRQVPGPAPIPAVGTGELPSAAAAADVNVARSGIRDQHQPFSAFYGAVYTESLFLLATALTFWDAARQRWWRVALWGLLAGLVRPNGLLLCLPLAVFALHIAGALKRQYWNRDGTLRRMLRPKTTSI